MSEKEKEVSPGGSSIFRHEAKEREWTAPAHAEMEELEAHFERHYGKTAMVFHEIVSDLVHIDVHQIPPTPERNYWTLYTTGMSALPMTTPEGAEDLKFAELVIQLPPHWKLDEKSLQEDDERWYWPVRWLKQLARLPHEYDTWLGTLHTIPNGDPPEPFHADTKLCCWLLLPPLDEAAGAATLADGRTVHIYHLHALYLEEVSLKLNKGGEALVDAMSDANVSEVLDPKRKSVTRKKLFGLF